MYRRGIHPSRAAERQCAQQVARLHNTLSTLLRRIDRRSPRAPVSDEPLVDYIFRYILPTVRCPRVHLWLRVRTLQFVPPDVLARDGGDYIETLDTFLLDDRREGRFGTGWPELYAQLTRSERQMLTDDLGVAPLPVLPWP